MTLLDCGWAYEPAATLRAVPGAAANDKLNAGTTLDALSAIHNLKHTPRARRDSQREYFRSFLSLVGWKKNDRRRHRHHFDCFRHRASTRQFADFSRS